MSGKNDPRSEKCGIWNPDEWKELTRTERPEGNTENNSDDNPEGGRRK